jgi:antitoxin (DNA-binding transcriptional repressor) of toxin-antitoxin stability system
MKRCLFFFHDTLSLMNSISVADLRNRFADVSAAIRQGEKLLVTMRGVPFATLRSD